MALCAKFKVQNSLKNISTKPKLTLDLQTNDINSRIHLQFSRCRDIQKIRKTVNAHANTQVHVWTDHYTCRSPVAPISSLPVYIAKLGYTAMVGRQSIQTP